MSLVLNRESTWENQIASTKVSSTLVPTNETNPVMIVVKMIIRPLTAKFDAPCDQ